MYRLIILLGLFLIPFGSASSVEIESPATYAKPTKSWEIYNRGHENYNKDHFTAAYEDWLPLAEQGYAPAQTAIGSLYENGRSVSQNYQSAIKWYELAAAQGEADAQYNLGNVYAMGKGMPQDDASAVTWFALAAEQEHTSSQYNLGVMYSTGRGVQQDDITAARWYKLASEKAT